MKEPNAVKRESKFARSARPGFCSQCGGELDSEGWCARYCMNSEGPSAVQLRMAGHGQQPPTRTERYRCPVCEREWDQQEQWDDAAQEWAFSDEPYGFCRVCTPEDDSA